LGGGNGKSIILGGGNLQTLGLNLTCIIQTYMSNVDVLFEAFY